MTNILDQLDQHVNVTMSSLRSHHVKFTFGTCMYGACALQMHRPSSSARCGMWHAVCAHTHTHDPCARSYSNGRRMSSRQRVGCPVAPMVGSDSPWRPALRLCDRLPMPMHECIGGMCHRVIH